MGSGGGSIRTAIKFGVDSKGRRHEYGKSTADISLVVTRSGRTAIMKLFVEYDDECCVCVWGNSFKMGVHGSDIHGGIVGAARDSGSDFHSGIARAEVVVKDGRIVE